VMRALMTIAAMDMAMPRSAPAFQISDALYADSTPVFIGRPMRFAYDLAIPVFTKHDGRTHLTFAYRSESRAVWRRFSGCLEGTYYRGSNERFQDFHWSIQKALDSASHIPAIEMKDSSGSLKKLHELDIWEKGYGDPILDLISSRLIREGENLLQESMARNAKPFVASYEPETFVAYWWAGAQESIYGPHVKLLVESQCNQYLYGVSITADGIFVSFVHDNDSNGITTAGSPAAGVLVTGYRNLFSPIVEHTENIGDQPLMEQLVELPNSGIGRTLVGISGRQICAEDLHESDKSPFRKLYNAVRVITRLLRQGSYEAADLRLQAIKNGTAPLLSDEAPSMPPQDKLQRAAEKRFEILADAYQLHSQGKLDQVEIGKHRLLPRDVQLIKKYFEQQKLTQAAQPEISAKICQSIAYERLRKVAVQWARDALESSSHSTWDGTSMPPT